MHRCKVKDSVAGIVRSFYILKTATPDAEEQITGPLPTAGFCAKCFLDLVEHKGAKPHVIAMIRTSLTVQRWDRGRSASHKDTGTRKPRRKK